MQKHKKQLKRQTAVFLNGWFLLVISKHFCRNLKLPNKEVRPCPASYPRKKVAFPKQKINIQHRPPPKKKTSPPKYIITFTKQSSLDHGNLRVPPPMPPPPPRNKALLRDYQPLISFNKALLVHLDFASFCWCCFLVSAAS